MQDEEFKPTDLEDILDPSFDEPEADVEDEPEAKPEEKPESEKPEGEGKGDKTGETPSPNDAEQTPREKASYAAQQDEKRKRKEFQGKLEIAEARISDLEKPKADPKPIPDPLDDPEGFDAYNKEQTNTNNQLLANDRLNDKFNRSEYDFRKDLKKDGKNADEVIKPLLDEFFVMCATDPSLDQKSRNHPHPYEFMRDTVENSKRHAEIDNLDDWRAKEKDKMRAEILAEGEGKAKELADAKSSIPETLGGEANQVGKDGKVVQTHTPLEDIVTNLEDRKPRKKG